MGKLKVILILYSACGIMFWEFNKIDLMYFLYLTPSIDLAVMHQHTICLTCFSTSKKYSQNCCVDERLAQHVCYSLGLYHNHYRFSDTCNSG